MIQGNVQHLPSLEHADCEARVPVLQSHSVQQLRQAMGRIQSMRRLQSPMRTQELREIALETGTRMHSVLWL